MEALKKAVTINDRYAAETPEAASDLRALTGLQQQNGLPQEVRQNLDLAR